MAEVVNEQHRRRRSSVTKATTKEIEHIYYSLEKSLRKRSPEYLQSKKQNLLIADLAAEQISDVTEQIWYFSVLRAAAVNANTGMPAALWPDIGPVPIDAIGSLEQRDRHTMAAILDESKTIYEELLVVMEELTHNHQLEFTYLEPADADKLIVRGAASAIVERINMMRDSAKYSDDQYNQYRGKQNLGLSVVVHSETMGAEVLYTAAYAMRYNQRFGGALSSPVESYIPPATYRFGIVLDEPKFEPYTHSVPPNFEIEMRL